MKRAEIVKSPPGTMYPFLAAPEERKMTVNHNRQVIKRLPAMTPLMREVFHI
jgi:hypothetical protein